MSRLEAFGPIEALPALNVRQLKEWTEIFTGWDTRNRYEIQDGNGQTLYFAGEKGGGFGSFFLRLWLRNRRPFTLQLKDRLGTTVMTVRRPWTWFFSRIEIFDGSGNPVGTIQQRFSILKRRYTVLDETGVVRAEIEGPLLRPWTFNVLVQGEEHGQIVKRWSGLLKESFTSADNFSLTFSPTMDLVLRALLLAATFLIDFVHFKRHH